MPGTSVRLRDATEGYMHFDENDRYNLYHRWSKKDDATAIKEHLLTKLHNRMALAWVPQPQPCTHTYSLAL